MYISARQIWQWELVLGFSIKLSSLGAMDETIPLNHLTVILTSFCRGLEGGQWFVREPWARKNIRRDSRDLSTLLEISSSVINADLLLLWTVFPGFMD